MKRDRKKHVKSRRSVKYAKSHYTTSALNYDEGFKKKFAEKEKEEEEVMLGTMYHTVEASEIEARMKEAVSKMQKELESQRSALADLRKKRSKKTEISKKEVEAEDEDDEFKVAVLDVGMATVKVL